MHERFLSQAKKGNIDLLFLGDSITQGWNNNEVWSRFYGPRKAANFGIGGDRTRACPWRIQNGELDGIAPKVTVLMIGTNNASATRRRKSPRGSPPLSTRLQAACPRREILLLGVFPRGQKPHARPRTFEIRQRQDRQARRRLARAASSTSKQRFLTKMARSLPRSCRISSSEPPRLSELGRRHGADLLVDA